MNWEAFAKDINGHLHSNSTGFIVGDTLIEKITRENKNETLIIEKKIRRSYGGSSHHNFENFEYCYLIKRMNFSDCRIVRKSYFKRLWRTQKNKYKIEGKKSELVASLTALKALEYLLRYPESELNIQENLIMFRSQSMGEMKEDLHRIHNSMGQLKAILMKRNKMEPLANKMNQCKCEVPPFVHHDFVEKIIGIDKRDGEIVLHKCKLCDQTWLRYYIDYNLPLIKTGRWYRGKISEDHVNEITVENAVRYLEQLDSYFYGGTYFDTLGQVGRGKLNFEI